MDIICRESNTERLTKGENLSNRSSIDVFKQQASALADEVKSCLERVDLLYHQSAALIPDEEGEAMTEGRTPQSAALLLRERLWRVASEFLEPAVELLRTPPEEEVIPPPRTSLDEVESAVDKAIEGFQAHSDSVDAEAVQSLRELAVEIEEVNQLGAEHDRRSLAVRLALSRVVLKLLPKVAEWVKAQGIGVDPKDDLDEPK